MNARNISPVAQCVFARPFLFMFVMILATCLVSSPVRAVPSDQIMNFTTGDMAQFVKEDKGNVVLLVLYRSTCSRCQMVMIDLIRLIPIYRSQPLHVLAFAMDDDIKTLVEYFGHFESLPFVPLRLIPWKSGDLGKALESIDVKIDSTFGIPLIAVIDRTGRCLYKDEAVTSLGPVRQAIEHALYNR